KTEVMRQLTYHSLTDGNFANARLVRNIIERGIRRQAVRLVKKGQLTRDELINIHAIDVAEESEGKEGP
ncbi:MAG: AAA family ATPase, partial [Bacillota bacterium]